LEGAIGERGPAWLWPVGPNGFWVRERGMGWLVTWAARRRRPGRMGWLGLKSGGGFSVWVHPVRESGNGTR
jgi:hypothetical protein